MEKIPDVVQEIARTAGGTITECERLPDGSGFALMSMPLPATHWAVVKRTEYEAPPMPLRLGDGDRIEIVRRGKAGEYRTTLTRPEFAEMLREAGKYAYRSATMGGTELDLDPDALLQNLIVGVLGYWTADGLSSDEWANPK